MRVRVRARIRARIRARVRARARVRVCAFCAAALSLVTSGLA